MCTAGGCTGVYHGHYRTDTRGVNLNRVYSRATHEAHPAVYASLAVAAQLNASGGGGSARGGGGSGSLHAFIDCHAHAARRGCFFFGNALPEEVDMVEAALYTRLVALNSRYFDWAECSWYEHEPHEGSARSALYTATGLPLIFTLECNYDSGASVNALPPRHVAGIPLGRLSPEPPPPPSAAAEAALAVSAAAVASDSVAVGDADDVDNSTKYTPDAWRDIGKALALALLDLAAANPASRLGAPRGLCGGGGLQQLRVAVAKELREGGGGRRGARAGDDDDA